MHVPDVRHNLYDSRDAIGVCQAQDGEPLDQGLPFLHSVLRALGHDIPRRTLLHHGCRRDTARVNVGNHRHHGGPADVVAREGTGARGRCGSGGGRLR